MAIETPRHTVLKSDGAIEVRAYEPMVVAEVTVSGDRGEAANRGFRPLANYIFGDNAPKAKIAMTAPVTQSRGEKIAMTAPVTQMREGASWQVRFVMPASYTMADLPKPNDPDVRLIEQPARRMAVLRFSGFAGETKLAEKERGLLSWMAARGLQLAGPVTYAFYDPPWTPPFMRRNEVMAPLP